MTRKILFVAMQMSTHTARWINQIADEGWDLHLFPVNYLPAIAELRGVTIHHPWHMVRPRHFLKSLMKGGASMTTPSKQDQNALSAKSIYKLPMVQPLVRAVTGAKYVRLGESDASAPLAYGPSVLNRLIQQIKPDLIHSMEFQHCGYNVLRAKDKRRSHFPPWLATNWGSDIYYYQRFDAHRRQISRLLKNIDFYSCECNRDVLLAKALGMDAYVLPVMPNTGGLDLSVLGPLRQRELTSSRRLIMVKGYQHFAGRALLALDAVERCSAALHGFKVLVFSPSAETIERVNHLKATTSIDIEVLMYASHNEMLDLFSHARAYLGVSISDAISTSMLEAMAAGAFPIQTSTACCDEWIIDGQSGFIIPPDDVEVIASRLCQALRDDALVDSASAINWVTVGGRLDQDVLKRKAIAFYDEIFENLSRARETDARE